MYICGACCGCCCVLNICDNSHRDFWVRQFYLILWGVFNYVWFIYLIDNSFWELFYYISDYLHLAYVLNAIVLFFLSKNIYMLLNSSRAARRQGFRGSDENDFTGCTTIVLILSFIHSPIPEGQLFFWYSLFPIILQLVYNLKRYWKSDSLIGVSTIWGLLWLARKIGWTATTDWLLYFITSCGLYFLEYSIVIGLSVFVGYQMNRVLYNIENYAELIKTRGKTKKQLALLYLKEVFQYTLLGFSLVFVYYCENLIEWYHGYSPVIISMIADLAYSYPAATLLKYPMKQNYFNYQEKSIFINFSSILFSSYLIRLVISFT